MSTFSIHQIGRFLKGEGLTEGEVYVPDKGRKGTDWISYPLNALYVYHISDCVTHSMTCKQGYLTLPIEGSSCFRCSNAKHGGIDVTNLSIRYLS